MKQNKDVSGKVVKSRYWAMISYPENMLSNWREICSDVLQVPAVYCVHDKDALSGRLSETGEDVRKIHVHWGLVFDGPTTFENAKRLINLLALPGKICCPVGEPVQNWPSFYRYLIHDTPGALALGKHLYNKKDRIEINNFDIDLYCVISERAKQACLKEIEDTIIAMSFYNYADLFVYLRTLPDPDGLIMSTAHTYSSHIERLCKGVYLKIFGFMPGKGKK